MKFKSYAFSFASLNKMILLKSESFGLVTRYNFFLFFGFKSKNKILYLSLGYKINNSRIDLSFEKFSLIDTHQMFDAGFLGNINLDKEKSVIKLSVVTVL